MKRLKDLLIVGTFALIVGSVSLLTLFLPSKAFSETENRYLRKQPVFSADALLHGSYTADAESYLLDQFPGRSFFVRLKAAISRAAGQTENHDVFFGSKDTLLQRVSPIEDSELARRVGFVNSLAAHTDIPVYFGLIPSAACIWADRLPEGAPTVDQTALLSQVSAYSSVPMLDLPGMLKAHADEPIFYRTDHHWTSLGALYGANVIFNALGMDESDPGTFSPVAVTDSFRGTSLCRSGAWWVTPDTMETFVPEDGISVLAYPDTKPEVGRLYHEEALDTVGKYTYFLGGNQPLCVLEAENDGPRVLLIRDSYSDSLAPFLTTRFSQVHLFDLRFNRMNIADYAAEHNIDYIIVLYSLPQFITDPNLALMSR